MGWRGVIYTNYQNGVKPHTRLFHRTSLTMIDVELTGKLSRKLCSKLSIGILYLKIAMSLWDEERSYRLTIRMEESPILDSAIYQV